MVLPGGKYVFEKYDKCHPPCMRQGSGFSRPRTCPFGAGTTALFGQVFTSLLDAELAPPAITVFST